MAAEADTYQFEPLKAHNWVLWKARISALFSAKELTGYIDGSITKPEETETDALKKWIKEDGEARLLLLVNIADSEMVHVSDLGTAAEMWKKFRMVKEPSSRLAARKNCIEPLLKRETTSPNTSSKSRQLEKNSMQWVYRSKPGISLSFSWLRCLNPGMYSRLLTWMHTTLV